MNQIQSPSALPSTPTPPIMNFTSTMLHDYMMVLFRVYLLRAGRVLQGKGINPIKHNLLAMKHFSARPGILEVPLV